jgi:hypothetical protein
MGNTQGTLSADEYQIAKDSKRYRRKSSQEISNIVTKNKQLPYLPELPYLSKPLSLKKPNVNENFDNTNSPHYPNTIAAIASTATENYDKISIPDVLNHNEQSLSIHHNDIPVPVPSNMIIQKDLASAIFLNQSEDIILKKEIYKDIRLTKLQKVEAPRMLKDGWLVLI